LVEIIVARLLVVIDHCWLNQNVWNTAWVPVMAEQTASAISRDGTRQTHSLLGFDHNSFAASCLFPASRSPHAYVRLFWWSNIRCPHDAIDFSQEILVRRLQSVPLSRFFIFSIACFFLFWPHYVCTSIHHCLPCREIMISCQWQRSDNVMRSGGFHTTRQKL
jgi:hypothetical protein